MRCTAPALQKRALAAYRVSCTKVTPTHLIKSSVLHAIHLKRRKCGRTVTPEMRARRGKTARGHGEKRGHLQAKVRGLGRHQIWWRLDLGLPAPPL